MTQDWCSVTSPGVVASFHQAGTLDSVLPGELAQLPLCFLTPSAGLVAAGTGQGYASGTPGTNSQHLPSDGGLPAVVTELEVRS